MADKLRMYNTALGHLEARRLVSLTENREPRKVLDSFWDDAIAYCLEQGLWRFAKRTEQINASTNVVPAFGLTNAFSIPGDWVRTIIISGSPNLDPPLLQVPEEAGFWYANQTPLYVCYVSNDKTYGMNLGAWSQSFADFGSLRLARLSCKRITGSSTLAEGLKKEEDRAKRVAKANDAMNDPPGLPPVALWARARRGAFGPGGLWLGGGTGGTVNSGPAGDD